MEWIESMVVIAWVFSLLVIPEHAAQSPRQEKGVIVSTTGQDFHMAIFPNMPHYDPDFGKTYKRINFPDAPDMSLFSVDVDYRNKTLVAYDQYHSSMIIENNFSVSDLGDGYMRVYHLGISRSAVQVAVDWLSHTVYWTDSMYRWIMAAPTDDKKISDDFYKIILDTDLNYPDGISLAPTEGLMFFSDNGNHPKIERASLDGSNRVTLVTSHLYSPWTLECDHATKRLYWIDSYREEIQSVLYDGSDRRLVLRDPYSVLYDMAIFRDILMVTDIHRKYHKLSFFNKSSGESISRATIQGHKMLSVAVYNEENQPMRDRDHCADLNCEHLCITTVSSAKCVCSEGYTLNTTSNKCQEGSGKFHKALVLTDDSQVCLIDVRQMATSAVKHTSTCVYTTIPRSDATLPIPTENFDRILFLEVDSLNRVIYFVLSDNNIYRRPIDLPIENDATEHLVAGTGNITGLAYDWIDGNLYWSEESGKIMMLDVEDFSVTVLTDNILAPEQLLVLAHERKLAWVSKTNTSTTLIQTMLMDNSGPVTTVQTENGTVVSLVTDNEKKLYWVVPKDHLIMEMDTNGTARKELWRDPKNIPDTTYLINVYKGFFKWIYTFNTGQYLVSVDKDFKVFLGRRALESFKPHTMKVLDVEAQPSEASPCAVGNGGCEQICVTRHSGATWMKTCECRLGFTVDTQDPTKCASKLVTDNFALVADWSNNAILQIDLATDKIHAFPYTGIKSIRGVLYDPTEAKVYWTESMDTRIYCAGLDGAQKDVVVDIGADTPYRMDKDLTTNITYYAANAYMGLYPGHIGIVTARGVNVWINEEVEGFISDIKLHPATGQLFIAVMNGELGYIGRMNMDGSNFMKIVAGGRMYPDGLALDNNDNTLYWSDFVFEQIKTCDLNGNNIQLFHTEKQSSMKDIATDGRFVYFTDFSKHHVVEIEIASKARKIYGDQLGHIDTLSLYKSTPQKPVAGHCDANGGLGDCGSICLPTSSGRTCACPDGYNLRVDGRTCTDVFMCSETIKKRSGSSAEAYVKSPCTRELGTQCTYVCPSGHVPTKNNTSVKCLSTGWDRENEQLCKAVKGSTSPVRDSKSGVSSGTVAAIVIVLVLFILALVGAVLFLMYRRKRDLAAAQFSYGRASFRSTGGNIGIENPGFDRANGQQTAEQTDITTDSAIPDDPYSNIGPIGLPNPSAGTSESDPGMVNPLYFNTAEPLPDVGHVTQSSDIPARY